MDDCIRLVMDTHNHWFKVTHDGCRDQGCPLFFGGINVDGLGLAVRVSVEVAALADTWP